MARFKVIDQVGARLTVANFFETPQTKNGIPPTPFKSLSGLTAFAQQCQDEAAALDQGTLAAVVTGFEVLDTDDAESVRAELQHLADRKEREFLAGYKERGKFIGLSS